MKMFKFVVNNRVYIVVSHSLITALLQLSDMVKGTISAVSCKVL